MPDDFVDDYILNNKTIKTDQYPVQGGHTNTDKQIMKGKKKLADKDSRLQSRWQLGQG